MKDKINNGIEQMEKAIHLANEKDDKYIFQDMAYDIMDEFETLENPFECVEAIFQLIERSPKVDYGGPGPFGSFLEQFYKKGYEEKLIESLQRKPTEYTVFLLHRICNDKKNSDREKYVALIKTYANSDFLDDYWKETIQNI